MPSFISSRHFEGSFPLPLTIDNAITIYEDRVLSWFLNIAATLKGDVRADFVSLMVIASYFEGFAIMRLGQSSKNQSRDFFAYGLKDVVKPHFQGTEEILDSIADVLYDDMRCGLFHSGMTRVGIGLDRGTEEKSTPELEATMSDDGRIRITMNVPKLLELVRWHFVEYLAQLRNPAELELRENFRKGWNLREELKKGDVVVGQTPFYIPENVGTDTTDAES